MEEVKISVNKDREVRKSVKKRGRPKKIIKKVSTAKKTVASKDAKASKKVSSRKKGGFFSSLIIIIITAVVVGGAIYAWQSRNTEKSVNSIEKSARDARMDFDQRLKQLKNKLIGIESENQKLKNTTKELEEKAKLLEGAKRDFVDNELGISFEYPAIFGEVKLLISDGGDGKKFQGTFSKNKKLIFGGISPDFYSPASTTDKISLLETQGYYKKRDKFYLQIAGAKNATDYEIIPTDKIELNKSLILLVDKKSFATSSKNNLLPIDIGENIAAIVNLEIGDFRGVSFINKDFSVLPLQNFKNLLNSIKIKE